VNKALQRSDPQFEKARAVLAADSPERQRAGPYAYVEGGRAFHICTSEF
jgi:hypothetical protein